MYYMYIPCNFISYLKYIPVHVYELNYNEMYKEKNQNLNEILQKYEYIVVVFRMTLLNSASLEKPCFMGRGMTDGLINPSHLLSHLMAE